MKKVIIFNPSIEGGGVENNIRLIFQKVNYRLKKNLYFLSHDKINGLDSSIKIISPIFYTNSKNRIIKYLICILTLIKFYIKEKNLLIFSFQANVYSIILSKILRTKIIVRANSAPVIWTNKFKIIIIKYFYNLADLIVVNSIDFKKEFKKIFNLDSLVILNPLDIKKIERLTKVNKKISFFDYDDKSLKIINIGRLTKQKNQIDLLKTIKLLKNIIPIKLLIIGNGSEKKKLTNYIKTNKLKSNIKIIPFQKNPYPYIKKSNIFILSSLYEGLPNVLLEAVFLKVLCVSYNCKTGPREILKNGRGGFLCPLSNYQKFYNILRDYYFSKTKKKYSDMINYSFKNLNKYNLKNQAFKYHKLIIKYSR
jgi:glycosyltransferase involved in cell wall biosynthesis